MKKQAIETIMQDTRRQIAELGAQFLDADEEYTPDWSDMLDTIDLYMRQMRDAINTVLDQPIIYLRAD